MSADVCEHGVGYDATCMTCDAEIAEAKAAGASTPREIGIYFRGKDAGRKGAGPEVVATVPAGDWGRMVERATSAEADRDMALVMHRVQLERADGWQTRAESLRARVEALADKWEGDRLNTGIDKEGAAYLLRDLLGGYDQ